MLSALTKKICPFISLALAFGCGKNINDPKTSSGNYQGQNQQLPADLTLQVDAAISSTKIYELPRNAWFRLPGKLIAKDASAVGKKIKIYYNLLSSGDYEFQCSYSSINQVTTMSFEKCESNQGLVIISSPADLENMQFPMDKGSSIKLQLTNPSGSGIKIESVYIVDWK